MRTEHDGLSLWYGTSDTPAPEGTVPAIDDITITVGVRPIDASNHVNVRYRVNQESVHTVPARWLRNEFTRRTQYFRARLPALHDGAVVEYTVICRCAGRQVPPPGRGRTVRFVLPRR